MKGYDKCQLCGKKIDMYDARLVYKKDNNFYDFCMEHEGTKELIKKIEEINSNDTEK